MEVSASGQARLEQLERVVCIGTTGSGKTSFARRLAAQLAAPHIALDALHWLPDWKQREPDDFRARVADAVSSERWVLDGNYSAVREIVWPRATTIVWLNYPAALVFARLLRRTLRRIVTQEPLFSGNTESFRLTFLSRDSLLVWFFRSYWKHRRNYREIFDGESYAQLRRIELRSPAATERFFAELRV